MNCEQREQKVGKKQRCPGVILRDSLPKNSAVMAAAEKIVKCDCRIFRNNNQQTADGAQRAGRALRDRDANQQCENDSRKRTLREMSL